jgi:hypothetical protein
VAHDLNLECPDLTPVGPNLILERPDLTQVAPDLILEGSGLTLNPRWSQNNMLICLENNPYWSLTDHGICGP